MKSTEENIAELGAVADALLSPCCLGLYQNDVALTPDTVYADLSICTFSGYADVTITEFSAPQRNPDGSATVLGGLTIFSHNGGGTANTVYGAFLTDVTTTPTILRYAWAFEAPIGMAQDGDSIPVVPKLTLG